MIRQRVRRVGIVNNLLSICLGIWTGKVPPRLLRKIRLFPPFIKTPSRTPLQSPKRLPAIRLGFADCGRMLRAFEEGASGVSKIASSGLDGKIVIWDVGLEGKVGGMGIRH
jgi:hypothetical protein